MIFSLSSAASTINVNIYKQKIQLIYNIFIQIKKKKKKKRTKTVLISSCSILRGFNCYKNNKQTKNIFLRIKFFFKLKRSAQQQNYLR